MPDRDEINLCPTVPLPRAGTAGHLSRNMDRARDSGGTVDLKALAFKVLQRSSVGQRRDNSGTSVVQNCPTRPNPVGQSQGLSGTSWTAEDWAAFYNERAAIREYDGRQTRREAEQGALAETAERWRVLNPLPPSVAEIGCVHCGKGAGDSNLVPHLASAKGVFWLHTTCWHDFDRTRRSEALAALRKLIPDMPGASK